MKKKILSSFFIALMVGGASSFSVFATTPNGTVRIGDKTFDLVYANDATNLTKITNAISQGGEIYVKNFTGNWINNTTGKIVDASVIPGETITSDTSDISDNADITSKFTDEIFKNKIYSKIGKTSSSPILYSDVKNIKILDLSSSNISSLNGIEYFKALTKLECTSNKITTLDVSKNTVLTFLECNGNKLTTLDVSENTALTFLECGCNNLTTLDVSKNTALTGLGFGYNKLTTLDVSKNTALTDLDCDFNNLTTLDVSKNTTLNNLACESNKLTTLDVSKNTALIKLSFKNNNLTTLDVSKNTALISLQCESNKLTTLDVSKNTALVYLNCASNSLTILDVSKHSSLINFNCKNNELTTLYSTKDTWDTSVYRPQYIDSTHTTTTDTLTIKIKN